MLQTHVEINIGSEVEVTFCSKDKGKKSCFGWSAFMIDFISAYKSQIPFMGLDFEADTAKNTVISTDFVVWKFCGKAQFPHSFGRFAPDLPPELSF